MIYLESPAGVGFSFCGDKADCVEYSDEISTDDNMKAFLDFMTTKFPELQCNDLYISGESYAGIYVPRLAERIDEYITNCTLKEPCLFTPNLKGFMVGNGVTDYQFDNIQPTVEMGFWFGLLNTTTYNTFSAYCNDPEQGMNCLYWMQIGYEIINNSGVNIYDAFGKCYNSSTFEPTIE